MATEPMLQIPLKVVVVRDMSVPHADAPGFFVDFAAVKGSSSGKYLYREDFSDLTNDEFLQKGLDELRKGEEQAFVAVYTDRSQSEIYRQYSAGKCRCWPREFQRKGRDGPMDE